MQQADYTGSTGGIAPSGGNSVVSSGSGRILSGETAKAQHPARRGVLAAVMVLPALASASAMMMPQAMRKTAFTRAADAYDLALARFDAVDDDHEVARDAAEAAYLAAYDRMKAARIGSPSEFGRAFKIATNRGEDGVDSSWLATMYPAALRMEAAA